MLKGYIRSTSDAVKLQESISALNKAGVFTDNIIITDSIDELMNFVSVGDVLVVCRVSELGDSLSSVFVMLERFYDSGFILQSVMDEWFNRKSKESDFQATLQEINKLNWEIISRRTKQGLRTAVMDGKKLGRAVGSKNKLGRKVNKT